MLWQAVKIPVTNEMMSMQDDSSPAGKWRVVPGDYQIRVGNSSLTDMLVANITL